VKELHLQDLLNMADAAAHDGICDLWNEKTIHHLVVFTSADADFEIIGVGPTLPVASLDDAGRHSIPGKKPEFFIKCPAAISGKLQPKLAPAALAAHPSPARNLARPAVVPTMKGRTLAPFMRPPAKLGLKLPETTPAAPSPATPAETPAPAAPPAPAAIATTPISIPDNVPPSKSEPQLIRSVDDEARERAITERQAAITQREQELSAIAASLKIREAALREREAAAAAREEHLLKHSTD
jgi:hypothetical protein